MPGGGGRVGKGGGGGAVGGGNNGPFIGLTASIVSNSGVALPSDAGAGDLLCSFSLFSVGVVGAAVVDGMGGIGTGGGGMTGGGMNGTAGFFVSPGLSLYQINGTLFPISVELVTGGVGMGGGRPMGCVMDGIIVGVPKVCIVVDEAITVLLRCPTSDFI